MHVAYVIQNAANDLAEDVGQAILIRRTVGGLQEAGHSMSLFRLQGRTVTQINDVLNLSDTDDVPLGISGNKWFLIGESAIRRLQRELRLPYLALFDAFRFYEACSRSLVDYDVCHEYGGLFSIGAALVCRQKKIPYILTVEADPFLENRVKQTPLGTFQGLIAAYEARIAYAAADKIVTVSEPAKEHLVTSWQVEPDKIVVMPNGVDAEFFMPGDDLDQIRADLDLRPEHRVIIFVGSFQQWHGIDNLLESFVSVRREVPDARLLLVGDGPRRPALVEKIADLEIAGSVTITGLVPHTAVPKMLAAADVAVLPYPQLPEELWFSPLKLYEYMAAGKPIVASGAGQILDVIRDGETGLLVKPGDVGQLARALVSLLEDPAERIRLGTNAREQVVRHHSWEQYIRRLEEVYLSAIKAQK